MEAQVTHTLPARGTQEFDMLRDNMFQYLLDRDHSVLDEEVRDHETGDVYKGYIVLFTVNGEIFAAESNSSQYLRDEWTRQCRNPPSPPAKEKKKKETETNTK